MAVFDASANRARVAFDNRNKLIVASAGIFPLSLDEKSIEKFTVELKYQQPSKRNDKRNWAFQGIDEARRVFPALESS